MLHARGQDNVFSIVLSHVMSTWYPHVISDTRLPPTFRAFISGGRRKPGDEVAIASAHVPVRPVY